MRKCFLSDNSGHWYAVSVDKRGYFNQLTSKMNEYPYDEAEEIFDDFETEFGDLRLNMHISNYSFEDLKEEVD